MRERQESGLSIKGYCEREGIHANVYHYWQRKLRESAAAELLPTTTQNSLRSGGWMEVSVGESTKKSGLTIEVSGCRIGVLPKSLVGMAISYLIGQWAYLKNIYLDGRLEFSNNRAERSIKPFVIGRKNWLFANTVNGATASSVIYSIIETAKENRLKPFDYLLFLLRSIPNTTTSKLDDFLPWSDIIPISCRIPDKRD